MLVCKFKLELSQDRGRGEYWVPVRQNRSLKAVDQTQLPSTSPKHFHYSFSQGKPALGLNAT